MSNEYKDLFRNRSEEAKEWVAKYPFLRFKNNDCCPWENTEEIESCWMFELPVGWINAFGEKMCDELLEALGEYVDDWTILQAKEKFGEMRIYHCWQNNHPGQDERHDLINNIIDKYSNISYKTCVHCGKPADIRTVGGWIAPYCHDCYIRFR